MKTMLALTSLLLCSCSALDVPAHYQVEFQTNIKVDGADGKFVMNVTTSWAPLGAEQIYKLVQDGFYDEAAFFRVVPNFVLQFGIAGTPAENKKWETPIKDDPVLKSNIEGTVTFATAGANTRTTQIFINYIDNSRLDTMGFAPFGSIITGMDVARAVYNPTPGDSGGVDQDAYKNGGNTWIMEKYPKINSIITAKIL